MAQQDQAQKCSNSNSGKSSRKAKQRKVPQRGLGVAQLERIREEQQRKEAEAASIFHHHSNHHHVSASIPCGADFTRLPLDDDDDAKKAASSSTFEAAWHSIPVHHHGPSPKLGDFEKEILSSMRLPFESNPTWLFQDWTQRTHQFHQQQPCSSMVVNDYSIIEPPSNQNYSSSSSCVPMKQEEKMVVGLKRSYPFSMDVPSASSSSTFNFKFPTFTTFMKTNETDSCASGTTGLNFDAATSSFREVVPSCSTFKNSEPNSKKSNKENENFNGDFLTLAPPPTPTSKFKSSTSSTFDFESPSSQGKLQDHQITHGQLNLQEQPLHSFFPPPKAATSSRSRIEKCNGGNGESIDLNLKL